MLMTNYNPEWPYCSYAEVTVFIKSLIQRRKVLIPDKVLLSQKLKKENLQNTYSNL